MLVLAGLFNRTQLTPPLRNRRFLVSDLAGKAASRQAAFHPVAGKLASAPFCSEVLKDFIGILPTGTDGVAFGKK